MRKYFSSCSLLSFYSLEFGTEIISTLHASFQIWRDDMLRKSMQIHNGAIFTVSLDGKWLFTGSWDRTIKAQELAGDDVEVDVRQIRSIPCDSIITALSYSEGKLFVGFGDRSVKVYYHEK